MEAISFSLFVLLGILIFTSLDVKRESTGTSLGIIFFLLPLYQGLGGAGADTMVVLTLVSV
uniref:Uncharacterized protein n=1 Tax=Anguilla anguilla TaxID=7936 RepID=A0A0E9X1C4_ANGAN